MADENIQKHSPAKPQPPRDCERVPQPDPNGWTIGAFLLGIFALLGSGFGCLTEHLVVLIPSVLPGLAAPILGIEGLRYCGKHNTTSGQGFAITGIVLSILALLANCAILALYSLGTAAGAGSWK